MPDHPSPRRKSKSLRSPPKNTLSSLTSLGAVFGRVENPPEELSAAKRAEIIEIATDFREGMLEGKSSTSMCWILSHPLAGFLSFCGIDCGSVVDGNVKQGPLSLHHCWIDMRNGIILDPTADQFVSPETNEPMPPVYLGKKPFWYDDTPLIPPV